MRWFYVEVIAPGFLPRFVGKVEATEADLRAALGPNIIISANGTVLVYGRP